VVREDKFHSEAVVKPSLASYTRPDPGACGSGNALVTVKARIGKDGVPVNVEIFDVPDPAAGKAVLDAAQAWKFNAATGSGEPRTADATLLLECNTGAPRQGAAPALRVGQGVSVPSLLYKVEPEFSEAARKIKHQGNVVLELEVDPAGIATNLKISRMLGEGLDAKAMEALKAWRFKPGMKDGKPVTVSARIEVSFRLM
jgi:TonB family protein